MKRVIYLLLLDLAILTWARPSNQSQTSVFQNIPTLGQSEFKSNVINVSAANSAMQYFGNTKANGDTFSCLVRFRSARHEISCSGSLIQMDLVLTAAHCLVDNDGRKIEGLEISVIAGDPDGVADGTTIQYLIADWVKIHPGFNRFTKVNDIGLIKLYGNFTATPAVSTIALPSGQISRSYGGVVHGWGCTNLTIVSNCQQSIKNPDGQFCAGTGINSCYVDSGGPFICNSFSNEICGIVSYGTDGRGPLPGVYTDVWKYKSWIEQNSMKGLSSMIVPCSHFSLPFYILMSVLFPCGFISVS